MLMAMTAAVNWRRFAVATLVAAALDLATLFLTEFLHRSHLE